MGPRWWVWATLLAVPPLVIGFHDLVAAADPPAKVLGLVLVLFAIGTMAMFGFALAKSSHFNTARFWGSLAGIGLATMILVSQYTRGASTGWRWLWWGLLAVAILALLSALVARLTVSELGSKGWWAAVGAIISSTVVAGLVQYWNRTYYAPLRERPQLVITGTLKPLSRPTKDFIPLDVHITVKNPTGIRVAALASLYTIIGVLPSRNEKAEKDFRDKIVQNVESSITGSSRALYVKNRRFLAQAGPLFPLGWYFEPGETFDTHVIVQVPRAQPRPVSVVLGVRLALAQGERLQLENPLRVKCPTNSKPLKPVNARQNVRPLENSELLNETAESCRAIYAHGYTIGRTTRWDVPQRHSWLVAVTTPTRHVVSAIVQEERYSTPDVFGIAYDEGREGAPADPNRLNAYYSVGFQWFSNELLLPRKRGHQHKKS